MWTPQVCLTCLHFLLNRHAETNQETTGHLSSSEQRRRTLLKIWCVDTSYMMMSLTTPPNKTQKTSSKTSGDCGKTGRWCWNLKGTCSKHGKGCRCWQNWIETCSKHFVGNLLTWYASNILPYLLFSLCMLWFPNSSTDLAGASLSRFCCCRSTRALNFAPHLLCFSF